MGHIRSGLCCPHSGQKGCCLCQDPLFHKDFPKEMTPLFFSFLFFPPLLEEAKFTAALNPLLKGGCCKICLLRM